MCLELESRTWCRLGSWGENLALPGTSAARLRETTGLTELNAASSDELGAVRVLLIFVTYACSLHVIIALPLQRY